jgi:hypothetical protein
LLIQIGARPARNKHTGIDLLVFEAQTLERQRTKKDAANAALDEYRPA